MKVNYFAWLTRVLELLAYLRAHSLLFYRGKDIHLLKMIEPTSIDFEIIVLEQYKLILELVKAQRFNQLNLDDEISYLESKCTNQR
jgi:hypothetical protein